jgi:flagellar protein FlaG
MNINQINQNNVDRMARGAHAVQTEGNAHPQRDTRAELPEIPRENMRDIAETLNSAARSLNQRVSFSVNDKTNRVIMKVINPDTNEVVREIPPRELMRIYEHIHDLIGMFVDESR